MEKPFIFVHITDIHIQKRSQDDSYMRFRHFVKNVLPMTAASLVINTGDITNSVNENNEGSKLVNNDDFVELLQFDEWKMFEPILHDNI